jgi:uncharacterized protein YegP (UPF0339 family)
MNEKESGFIAIYKSKTGYWVSYFAVGNAELLAPSEMLASRANCLKNIRAMARLFSGKIPLVMDYTGKLAKTITVKP